MPQGTIREMWIARSRRQGRRQRENNPIRDMWSARSRRQGQHAKKGKRVERNLWLSQVEFGSDGAEAISELAPRAYAGHVHAAVSEERARKGGQEDGQARCESC